MKKFLSLLLALTLVLSLVVVPARADVEAKIKGLTITSTGISSNTVAKGGAVSFTVSTNGASIVGSNDLDIANASVQDGSFSYSWNLGSNFDLAPASVDTRSQTVNATASVATTESAKAKVTCTVTCSYTVNGDQTPKRATATVELGDISVTDAITRDEITGIQFNGRNYGNDAVYYVGEAEKTALTSNEGAADRKWVISSKTKLELVSTSFDNAKNEVTLNVKRGTTNGNIIISATEAKQGENNITVSSPASSYRAGMELTLDVPNNTNKNSPLVSYKWSAKDKDNKDVPVLVSADNKWTPAVAGEYTLTREVYEGSVKVGSNVSDKITIAKDSFAFVPKTHNTSMSPKGTQTLSFEFYSLNGDGTKNQDIDLSSKTVTWTVTGTGMNAKNLAVTKDNKSANLTIPASGTGSTCAVTVSFVHENKTYSHTYNINLKTTTALLPSIENNTPVTLYGTGSYGGSYNLATIAKNALFADKLIASNDTVASVVIELVNYSNCIITQTSLNPIAYTMTSPSIGTATFKAKATVTGKGEFPITFSATVTPIATTYEAQYPEPVASYGNTYKYYVQVPAGASYYYVVGTPNQSTTPTDFTQGGKTVYYTTTQSTSLYALTDANFVNGQCTLWIVTKRSADNKLCYGQLTVYQKNYNINYNGVAGETVQFKHTDFTNFMNEVAQARGDSSKTGSYPYVTFSYVTFDYPSTAQGTLYYNGTAMSTSSYSGAFNSRTQITNLDNITFVPYAKTNAKTVAVTFTLHAVKYGTNGTVVNRDVQYRGTVNISLVREDVTFTVAPGDSVTFTDSDFLNYLRAQSGINYNYNIDYVTFDQSAVDTINGGVLYSGYAGFNAVKPTDKFYYTTTNNYTQNALSDVTFRASTYAKTGTTVYIPFTIYARYGTTGAGTRQVTGTVAVKIAQTMNFVDVKPTDYFYNPVKWAVGKNITKGTSAVTFSPDRTCTRAEIVTFLWRDAGSPMPTISRSPFSDVNYSMGADFYNAILWASQNGITAGTDVSHFSPNKTCTRAEIVTFLWRYAKKPVGYGSNSFTDVNKTDHAPYYDAILWAVSKGITNGSTTTTFAPDGTCTRGQAVTFLYRYEGGK